MMLAASGTLGRFFAGICEHVFESRLGVVDPPLVDYVTDLMVRFVRFDCLTRVRSPSGEPIQAVVDMLGEAESRSGIARRDVHRHIGDVTLFWTGVYPESLPALKDVSRKDFFVNYCEQGKRAYFLASTIETDRGEDASRDILERLSREFELCAYGLGEVRREWERRDEDGPSPKGIIIK